MKSFPKSAARSGGFKAIVAVVSVATGAGVGIAQPVAAAELVVNGSFEDPVVTNPRDWMSYYGSNVTPDYCQQVGDLVCPDVVVPGWEVYWQDSFVDDVPGALPGRLELQRGAVGNITAVDGDQKAELDSHYRNNETDHNIVMAQSVRTCARTGYEFSYNWKARRDVPRDNDIVVLIDDEVLVTHTEFRPTWARESYRFFANDSGLSGVAFTSVGTGNTLGMFIDAVSIVGQDGSDPANCEPPPAVCGEKPAVLTLLYDADLNGEDFYSQDPSEVSIESFYDQEDGLPAYVKIKVYDHFRKRERRTELFSGAVQVGETIDIAGTKRLIPPRLFIDIHSADTEELLQTIEFHTSCSQPLNVGDEFGGIAIWGFRR